MGDLPDHVELAVGERLTFELPGLGTAGYAWEHEIAGEDGVVDASWNSERPAGSQPVAVGENVPESITMLGLRPGAVTVRLLQRRPWEPPDQVIAEHTVAVVVRAGT